MQEIFKIKIIANVQGEWEILIIGEDGEKHIFLLHLL